LFLHYLRTPEGRTSPQGGEALSIQTLRKEAAEALSPSQPSRRPDLGACPSQQQPAPDPSQSMGVPGDHSAPRSPTALQRGHRASQGCPNTGLWSHHTVKHWIQTEIIRAFHSCIAKPFLVKQKIMKN